MAETRCPNPNCQREKVYSTERALILDPDQSAMTRLAASKQLQRRLKWLLLAGSILFFLSFGIGIVLGRTSGVAVGAVGFLLAIGAVLFWFNLEHSAAPNNPRVRRYRCGACDYTWFLYTSEMDLTARWLEQTLQRFRTSDHRPLVGNLLVDSGLVSLYRGDLEAARRLSEEALALYRNLQDEHGQATALGLRGVTRLFQRDHTGAEQDLRDGLAMHKRLGTWKGVALTRSHLALLAQDMGDEQRAHLLLQQSLSMNVALQNMLAVGWDLIVLAELAIRRERAVLAARASETASRLFEDQGWPLPAPLQARHQATVAATRAALDGQTWETIQQKVNVMPINEVSQQVIRAAGDELGTGSSDPA